MVAASRGRGQSIVMRKVKKWKVKEEGTPYKIKAHLLLSTFSRNKANI